MKNRLLTFLVAGVLSLPLLGTVRAQNAITLSVSPPLFELSANPGESLKNSVRLENPTDNQLKITTELRNFTALGEEGSVNLTEEETSFSLASWIEVSPTNTTLAPRSSKTFNFTIDVPANAEPGGHFGSIVFKTVPEQAGGQGATVEQEIGALLLVKVAGDINESASIASFDTAKNIYQAGPVEFETRIHNSGNVHFKPGGTITIKNLVGREVTALSLDERNVLPDSVRKITTEWSPSGFKLGRYTATLNLVYGAADNVLTASTSFYIIPYKIVVPAIVVLLILTFLTIRYRGRIADALRVLAGRR